MDMTWTDNWFWAGCITTYLIYDFCKTYWLRTQLLSMNSEIMDMTKELSEDVAQIREELSVDLLENLIIEGDEDDDSDDEDVIRIVSESEE